MYRRTQKQITVLKCDVALFLSGGALCEFKPNVFLETHYCDRNFLCFVCIVRSTRPL